MYPLIVNLEKMVKLYLPHQGWISVCITQVILLGVICAYICTRAMPLSECLGSDMILYGVSFIAFNQLEFWFIRGLHGSYYINK